MGQQQLLLLVLGIVIVGLAVVVGIQAFGENQKKANADALTNDAIRITSDAQAWALKPTAFGGGNGSFAGLNFTKLGYETGTGGATTGNYGNLNGAFTLTAPAANTAPAVGTVTILGCNKTTKNSVTVTVTGVKSSEIGTVLSDNAGTCAAQS